MDRKEIERTVLDMRVSLINIGKIVDLVEQLLAANEAKLAEALYRCARYAHNKSGHPGDFEYCSIPACEINRDLTASQSYLMEKDKRHVDS